MIAGISKPKLRARAGKCRLGRGRGPEPEAEKQQYVFGDSISSNITFTTFFEYFSSNWITRKPQILISKYAFVFLFHWVALEIANDLLVRAKKRQSNSNTVKSYWSYKQVKTKGTLKLLWGGII